MSKIQDMRDNPENQFNFIKLLERLSDEKDTKYIQMLDRLIKQRIYEKVDKLSNESFGDNQLENAFIAMLFSNILLPQEMYLLNYFCAKHKQGGINGVDFQKVEMDTVLQKAMIMCKKELEAQKENMIEKIHEDEDWLLVMPLSYEASLKYGAHTKWCTASKDTKDHYQSYTHKGILIYCINKKDDTKYGFYYDLEHKSASYSPSSAMSFWNAEDDFVEMFDVEMPMSHMKILADYTKNNKIPNERLMKRKYRELFENNKIPGALIGRDSQIIEKTKQGKSLAAVKLIREIADIDLKAAKDLYNNYYRPTYHSEN